MSNLKFRSPKRNVKSNLSVRSMVKFPDKINRLSAGKSDLQQRNERHHLRGMCQRLVQSEMYTLNRLWNLNETILALIFDRFARRWLILPSCATRGKIECHKDWKMSTNQQDGHSEKEK
jgi:hypothetical protein